MTLSSTHVSTNGSVPATTAKYGHHPLHDRSRRPLHVIVVGAGPSGIATLIELKKLPFITITCFEKNSDVGGTWLETRYPGAACDVASHAYQYTFDSKTDWSRHFAPAEEIGQYFISVAEKHDLYPTITFNSRVIGAEWDESKAIWRVQVTTGISTGNEESVIEEHQAHIFINAGGILNDWKWPDIEGLELFKGTRVHTAAWWAEKMMKGAIASPQLQEKLIPSWELGCRRLTPSLPYLKAVQEPNVDVIRTGIRKITETGIETEDGKLHKADILICATGFNTSFSSRFKIIGRGGLSLKEMWKARGPEAYLGTAIAGLPNYFTLLGPNCPIANGSLTDQIRSLNVKKPLQDAFNEYVQEVHKDLVWTGSCNSWYKDRQTGRVIAVWPGSSIHFMEMIENPRWEDFDIDYLHSNPFTFMGNGISQRETTGQDLTFYLDDMVGKVL
ncbi:hypothetical protein NM208_g3643 [Fusarium decemcellulare]|uniref:Uncharacterized protein n=1 Tax=Fusarium decemcellulare TaxID=57161 RepID=A0ACC1SNV6_9HYPO|nr:hypothetical protein NM208_g3643 [Fusarium decemcellulare]